MTSTAAICRVSVLGLCFLLLNGCATKQAPDSLPFDDAAIAKPLSDVVVAQKRQQLMLGQVYYQYFLEQPDSSLLAIELANKNAATARQQYAQLDRDRLDLMQGSASLQLGLINQAETIFKRLLDQSSDPYIKANTWFWLAKSSFAQKRFDAVENAYAQIVGVSQSDELVSQLSIKHWHELLYQVAYVRQLKGCDWQSISTLLPLSSIYRAYLTANNAIELHNQGELSLAQTQLIDAKQKLLALSDDDTSNFVDLALLPQDTVVQSWRWYNPLTWFGSSQIEQEEKQIAAIKVEQSALLDRLNLALGTNLLAQRDYANSLSTLQLIGADSVDADQALLTFAWTLARENRWPLAMAVWQYLRDNNQGIYGLQASYGMAYGYEQQGALNEAFYALKDTAFELQNAVESLSQFRNQITQAKFFEQDTLVWPERHNDLRQIVLTGDGQVDTAYLLDVYQQSKNINEQLAKGLAQTTLLKKLVEQRQQNFLTRSQTLSVDATLVQLTQTENAVLAIKQLLEQVQQQDFIEDIFSFPLANPEQQKLLSRLQKAKNRMKRLQENQRATNPDKPLRREARYLKRLDRIEGLLIWQLNSQKLTTQRAYQQKYAELSDHLLATQDQYQSLLSSINNQQDYNAQLLSIENLALKLQTRKTQNQALTDNITQQLSTFLVSLIDTQTQQLNEQQIATRLALVSLQDKSLRDEGL